MANQETTCARHAQGSRAAAGAVGTERTASPEHADGA